MATASQGQFMPGTGTSAHATTLVRGFVAHAGQSQVGIDTTANTTSIAGRTLSAGQPVTLLTRPQGVQLIQPVSLGQAMLTQTMSAQGQHQKQQVRGHVVLDGWGGTEAGDGKPHQRVVRIQQ